MSLETQSRQLKQDFDDVYEAGKEAEYDAFWDSYQDNGNKRVYELAFAGTGWKTSNFKPKYPMKPTNASMMFYKANGLLGEIEEIVNIDFSSCTNFRQAFQNCHTSRLGVIDLRKATDITNTFVNCYNMEKIDKIIVDESLPATLMFSNDTALKNVIIEGELVKNFSAGACPLTVESLKSIITALKDNSGTADEYKYTVTFLASAFETLEAEGDTAEYNGVACTWAELIDNKKWNLVKA